MANLTILRSYVQAADDLPSSILFKKSSQNIVIFDGYPKSIFHFLVLPLIREPELSVSRLDNLQSLLKGDKETAKGVIEGLATEAMQVKKDIEDEMLNKYGFKWDVWLGFHAAPSMAHLHLHVLSADLCSEKMKNKKHYNSFHPKLGFFLHLEEVLSWFDSVPSFFTSKVGALKRSSYEQILKEPLVCFKCDSDFKNIPALKTHLQEEWEKIGRRAKLANKKKRKLPPASEASEASTSSASKLSEEPEEKRSRKEDSASTS